MTAIVAVSSPEAKVMVPVREEVVVFPATLTVSVLRSEEAVAVSQSELEDVILYAFVTLVFTVTLFDEAPLPKLSSLEDTVR